MTTIDGSRAPLELRAFIDSIPAFAWSAGPDGSPEFVNRRLQDYTGLSPDQLYGEWKSILHRDEVEDFENWWQGLLTSGKPGQTELRLRRFDGEYRWFQISAVPVHDERGHLVAHRISKFPAAGHVVVKDRVNAIALAPAEEFRRDSDLFREGVSNSEAQHRIEGAMKRGFQTRDAEMSLARMLGEADN